MSLKAKLEAVIYAAEEPVTLAQLAALFAAEALEWKSEQSLANEQAAEVSKAEASEPLSLIPSELVDAGIDEPVAEPGTPEPVFEPVQEAAPSAEAEPAAEAAAVPADEAAQEAENPIDAEQEARRLTRQRDREVRAILRQVIEELIAEYDADGRGVEIREIAGGYRMATKPECHDAVRLFVKSLKPAMKLSLPALETLAVIAYKQPVTAPEVNEIRGVDSSGVFGSLIARKLIATAGRKQVIGRPILYKTTREFLLRFGLKDVAELPSMEEFEKMAAIELEEPEPASNEAPADSSNLEINPELDENASEEPEGETPAGESESPAPQPTAETAASPEIPPSQEAAPVAPHPTEQAETENPPHGEEDQEER
jgi:segregation and condensation protein B